VIQTQNRRNATPVYGFPAVRASFVQRTAANVLDTIPFALAAGILMRRWEPNSTYGDFIRDRVLQAVYVIVPTVVMGGTPGQRLRGLAVIDRRSGQRLGWGRACQRWLIGIMTHLALTAMRQTLSDERRTEQQEGLQHVGPELERLREDYSVPIVTWAGLPAAAVVNAAFGGLRDRLTGTLVVQSTH
jgi:RDD family protein